MNELVVISGKGGTGKTSITASLAVLAGKTIIADCDVDAADLHLLLEPTNIEKQQFYSGNIAKVNSSSCIQCGKCEEYCRFGAFQTGSNGVPFVDHTRCEGCGVCVKFCPSNAIVFDERHCGEWMVSNTRAGSMVHAKLNVAAENSGRLVSTVRKKAQEIAMTTGVKSVIIDGPPGIGCPVIASVTGASRALIVTEPTVSGAHDLDRVLKLTKHFSIPSFVCVNKWDINSEMTDSIEALAQSLGAKVVGRIRYDSEVSKAQIIGKTVVETSAKSGSDIKEIWKELESYTD